MDWREILEDNYKKNPLNISRSEYEREAEDCRREKTHNFFFKNSA